MLAAEQTSIAFPPITQQKHDDFIDIWHPPTTTSLCVCLPSGHELDVLIYAFVWPNGIVSSKSVYQPSITLINWDWTEFRSLEHQREVVIVVWPKIEACKIALCLWHWHYVTGTKWNEEADAAAGWLCVGVSVGGVVHIRTGPEAK